MNNTFPFEIIRQLKHKMNGTIAEKDLFLMQSTLAIHENTRIMSSVLVL